MPTHATGTTSPDLTSVLTTWVNKKFISDLEFALQHQKFTTKAVIPTGSGNIGRFVTFAAPTKTASYSGLGTTALTEGTTTQHEITGIAQTSTNLTPSEFGEFTKITSLYEFAAVAGTRDKIMKRLRDGAAYTLDSFTRSKAALTTNILYATATATGATSTGPAGASGITTASAAMLITARKTLFDNLATGFDDVPGHPSNHFAAVITPKQELDIVTEISTTRMYWSSAVVNVPGRMGQEKFVNGYIGSIYGTAVYTTNNYATTAYTTLSFEIGFVYSDGGVGAMAFGDMAPEIVINDVNSPYKNVNSIAWHAIYDAALIDSARVIKLYSSTA